jgi:hypothetical protein
MNDGWNIARLNFTDDDGSLPGIELRNLRPNSVRNLVNYFFHHGKLTADDATLWHNQMQANVLLNQVEDPVGLVISGIAEPFHCCFQLHSQGVNTIPILGLFVFQDVVEIDYRMGGDWNPENVDAFFRLLVYLKSIAPEANVESADCEGLPYPVEFKNALGRYINGQIA